MKQTSLLLFLVLFFSCNSENKNPFGFKDKTANSEIMLPSYEGTENEVVEYDDATNENNLAEAEQKIIKNATIRFETNDMSKTRQAVLSLTQKLNGLVQNDYSGKEYNSLTQNLVIRIPTKNFQPFLDGLSKNVTYFDEKTISRQDVTEEFVDLSARLKAKRTLENRYLELLKKAKNVSEILEIEKELAIIREEIEAKQGRLNYLQNRVSFSTVNIEFYKITDVKSASTSYWQKMKNSIKGGWNGVSVFFLGLLYLWPFFLLIGIIIFIVRRILKKKEKLT